MANAPVIQTGQQFWGLKRETTVGTYAAPSAIQDFLFVEEGYFEDIFDDIFDESFQADFAMQHGYFQGTRYGKVTLKGIVSQAASGHLFRAALGAISESGTTDPFTHNFTMRTGQGPSYTVVGYDATITQVRAMENSRCQSLTLSYGAGVKGLLKFEAVFIGKFIDVSQTKMTPTFDTAAHFQASQNALTYNGSNGKLNQLTLKIENEVEPVPGSTGNQDIIDISQNRIKAVTVDGVFAATDATEINNFRNKTETAFTCVFTIGTHSLTLQMTKFDQVTGSRLAMAQNDPFAKWQFKGNAVDNTTDAGPIKIILLNAVAANSY